ncbi:pyridoxal-5'-phosphate-dependent protein subunit beta [Rhodoplanes sp. TEM]|uniref:pyridoxal-phosphate dependent enzyme n=1 Tax=Rhodoplanes TaxID=29407 RepID=UPI002350F8AB|nr:MULTISPECIES: pyridoxal-phosphate dependent enzyme [Rhodoplanes]MDC7987658.1 pyridoxal-5'-phosphate-dependent protein subunit beta [Rhodoplanes sp. TEM]MDQ0358050.1 cysteine synthase [Rhodoplanes tepidamans]
MARLGLERTVVDTEVYARTNARFREANVVLPTIAELANPTTIDPAIRGRLKDVDPDSPHPLNLFRVHWWNDAARRELVDVPGYVELPSELTGVKARIVLAVGDRFPMIAAHKVLAAYGCLVPRVVTGQFDPTHHRAIWPSTGNYCRGGVAISRILGCRGVAVLPENMSKERFDWLDRWVTDPSDIIRTPGSESNVKEIYDACAALDRDPDNIIFNQFCEFGNYVVHRTCTGAALAKVFETVTKGSRTAKLAAYVSATGSAGTLAAGDHLKKAYGTKIVAVEAEECPTLLYNGFGEHNIQGIGDKHVPFIHNVMNTDMVVGISDHSTDTLFVLFNTDEGRKYLVERRGIDPALVAQLPHFGLSGLCNLLAAIKAAKYWDLGSDDVIMTVATDGSAMYGSEIVKAMPKYFGNRFDQVAAGETFGRVLGGIATDHLIELTHVDRKRIFNLGYFTWVEQQGVSLEEFTVRARQSFWDGLLEMVPAWDEMIRAFNAKSGAKVK